METGAVPDAELKEHFDRARAEAAAAEEDDEPEIGPRLPPRTQEQLASMRLECVPLLCRLHTRCPAPRPRPHPPLTPVPPLPPPPPRSYGGALRPGEGSAIAQYVQKNLRIPRRGEVGWTGDEIEQLEDLGYVMSGSRHRRMNAIRIRKENQVYTAEEKRALALLSFEQKQQKESEVVAQFRDMLQAKQAERQRRQDGPEV